MNRPQRKAEDPPKGAPAYIVTFSDMITLLLTFFVLLLSLADNQDKGLFSKGQNSFRRAIADFGMSGIMYSKEQGNQFNHPKIKYKIEKGEDKTEDRSIDATTEVFRRTLEDIEKRMKILPSQITCKQKNFIVTDIEFEDGNWTLDQNDKKFIADQVRQLQEGFVEEHPTIYVVGIAVSEKTPKQQWIVSAKRAQSVTNHLKSLAPDWSVFSWGAGPGGDWTSRTGLFSNKTDIIIAVLDNEE